MLELIEQIKTTARTKRGIELETEVQIVGEDSHEVQHLAEQNRGLDGRAWIGTRRLVGHRPQGSPKRLARLARNVLRDRRAGRKLSVCRDDVDLAFIAIHGTFGEDGQLQANSGRARYGLHRRRSEGERTSRSTKSLTKEKFAKNRMSTARMGGDRRRRAADASRPYRDQGAAAGSTSALYHKERRPSSRLRWRKLRKYDRELLVEKFVPGSRIDDRDCSGDSALPILEIIPKGGFYDFTNKYPFLNPQAGGGAEHVCPAKIDPRD